MFLSEVTRTLRRSVYSCLTLHHRNQLCRTYYKQISVHPAKSYCSYTKEFETYKHPRQSLQLNENVKDKTDDVKKVHIQGDDQRFSHDLKLSKDRIQKLYNNPVGSLISIYKSVHNEFKDKEYMNFNYEVDNTLSFTKQYKCIINVSWPTEQSFVHVAPNKKAATKHAAWKCLHWLNVNNKVRHLKPILYNRDEIRTLMKQPVRVNLDSEFKNEIQTLVDTFDCEIKSILATSSTIESIEDVSEQQRTNFLVENEESDIINRNSKLASRVQVNRIANRNLPVLNYKKEILDSLETNRVLLIKGDTGCGKSTQIPQFIMDVFAMQNKANECNILVSQPRRISAISLANRIAQERYEVMGDVVGYHVRLQKFLPKPHGSILFCTTGILLQRIQRNPTLKGVSHVIIDEAHERTLQIDMLLALLKRTLNVNPSLKVMIMSATVNVELFQQYFSCAVIDIPGKLYPVKMHFLDDIDLFKGDLKRNTSVADTTVPYEKIVSLIQWLVENKPLGAILCFLPGWQEIKELQYMLEKSNVPSQYIIPLHSKLSIRDQQKVFHPVPEYGRKIILATDIAESSITIQDVTYVIDTVLKKEMQWNEEKYMYSLNTTWISQANICQRKGRAGRTRPGESYHFITKKEYNRLNVHPVPEIRRTSLEQAIILSKTYNNEKINDFFNSMLEQPSKVALVSAITTLQRLNILDENENLTALGERIKNISLEPKLSRALVFSNIFLCLNDILNIIVMFTIHNEIAVTSLIDKSVKRKEKERLHETSDHIAALEYFSHLSMYVDKPLSRDNYNKNGVHMMQKICELHLNELVECGIVGSESDCESANAYADSKELIRAVLYSATNQLLTRSNYGYKNGYFTKSANVLLSNNNEKVVLKKDSVNCNRKIWPSPFLTHIIQVQNNDQRTCMVPDTSIISPLTVLLFSQGDVECQKVQKLPPNENTDVIIQFKNLRNTKLCCDEETATLLLELRNILWNVVDYIIRYEGIDDAEQNLKSVKSYRNKLVCLLSKILHEASKDIDASDQFHGKDTSIVKL